MRRRRLRRRDAGDAGDDDHPEHRARQHAPAVRDSVKVAIFERAYSECASTEPNALKAKYNLRDTTNQVLATGVAQAWIKFFQANQDAYPDGRDGCLQGLQDRDK